MVAEDAPADTQHHGPVTPDQGREGDFGDWVTPRRESLHELTVRERDDSPGVEGDINLPKDRAGLPGHRGSVLLQTCFLACNVAPTTDCSILRDSGISDLAPARLVSIRVARVARHLPFGRSCVQAITHAPNGCLNVRRNSPNLQPANEMRVS